MHRGLLSNLVTKTIGVLVAISLLTPTRIEGLDVLALEGSAAVRKQQYDAAQTAELYGEPTQDRQKKKNDMEPQSLQQKLADSVDALRLGFDVFQLSTSPTKESATEVINKSNQAFALFKRMDFKAGMTAALFGSGAAYYFLGKNREALNAFLEALEYSKESGDLLRPVLEASIGAAYWGLGETSRALETLERALPLVRGQNNLPMIAQTLKALGEINVHMGQKRKALEYLDEARALYMQTGDWLQEVQVLPLISALRSSLGQSAEALATARAAVDRAKEKNSPDWEAYGYFAVGAAYASTGNLEEAADAYNRSLILLEGRNDGPGEATALNNLGLIYVSRGDLERASNYFERALKLAHSSNDPKLAAYANNNIGTIYYRRGEPLKALRRFEEALAVARRDSDRRLEAAVLSSMANVYFGINSRDYALKILRETAASFKQIEEPAYESEALISLADAYAALERYQDALDVLSPVLRSRRIAEDPGRQGYVLREMGYIYGLMGDRGKALTHYVEALSKLEAAGDEVGQVDLYTAMGTLSAANADYPEAEARLTKGLALARQARLRQSESLILAALGSVHERLGSPEQAERFYDQAIILGESLRSSARLEELKSEVANLSAALLSPAILLKMRLGKFAEAFALTEMARARTFLDQMNNAHVDIRKGGDARLADQEQALRFEMGSLEEKLRKERRENPRSDAAALMTASLKEKEETYSTVLMRLKVSNPKYAELQGYDPAQLDEIQRGLSPQATLVSYFVTPDKTLAFVVSSNSAQAVEIPVKETELRTAVQWFRGFASLSDPHPSSLKQLYAWLIMPIRQYIKTDEVVIVPHGVLHYVPFAALSDGSSYFGDEHAIYFLPSASILKFSQRRAGRIGTRVLAVSQSRAEGQSLLRYADKEAAGLANLFHAHLLPTGRATKAEFKKRAPSYDIVHIAAHAELNTNSPLFSRILLSPAGGDSGAVEVREVYGLDLGGTDLVVLSSCQSLLGAHSKGDDIVGLNRAFLYAGASSVIASLWTVDDEATSVFMKAFYGNLKHGKNKAAALQAAQVDTRKKYPHPYYWAAFVLTGDPGRTYSAPLVTRRRLPRIR